MTQLPPTSSPAGRQRTPLPGREPNWCCRALRRLSCDREINETAESAADEAQKMIDFGRSPQ